MEWKGRFIFKENFEGVGWKKRKKENDCREREIGGNKENFGYLFHKEKQIKICILLKSGKKKNSEIYVLISPETKLLFTNFNFQFFNRTKNI